MGKRYYWLKMQNDFFRDKRIKKLRKIAGGDTFTVIYLKMMLSSLENEGIIEYEGVEETFADEIALLLDEDADNVAVTVDFLIRSGLLLDMGNNQFALPFVVEHLGSEGASAKRVREYRDRQKALQCNTEVTEVKQIGNGEKEKEIEKEIEIDKKDIPAPAAPIRVSNAVIGEEFEKLWGMLPKKRGDKRKALNAYTKARKAGTTMADVMIGINAYKAAITVEQTPDEYIMQAATFFTQQRWLDDWTPHRARDRNAFNNIETHEYDMDALEAELLGAGGGK